MTAQIEERQQDNKNSEIFRIAGKMVEAGYSSEFARNALNLAFDFEAAKELMVIWLTEEDSDEREAIIADIQDLIEDAEVEGVETKPYIPFEDLSAIADNVMAFKDRLRQHVDEQGGVTKLADETGIPQPSLSRFFNSSSMPQRSLLLKIADALELSEKDIKKEWLED